MPADQFSSNAPQFTTADYASQDSVERCASCKTPIGATYYRVNGALACESCARKVGGATSRDTHAAFMRALLYGFGAALLGLVLYAFVEIALNMQIGIVALAVGYMVARGMKIGSRGVGGRRYQIAAVLFTYFAVSVAAVPAILYAYMNPQPHAQVSQQRSDSDSTADSSAQSDDTASAPAPQVQPVKRRALHLTPMIIVKLIGLGLASPFLSISRSMYGVIGIFILFIGMRIAWRMTATHDHPTNVVGPFATGSSTPALAPATPTPSGPPPPLG
jgi:hypothetical protein